MGPHAEVYVPIYGAARVLVFASTGALRANLGLPVPYVTNVALAADGHHLYVTASKDTLKAPYPGAIYELRLPR